MRKRYYETIAFHAACTAGICGSFLAGRGLPNGDILFLSAAVFVLFAANMRICTKPPRDTAVLVDLEGEGKRWEAKQRGGRG